MTLLTWAVDRYKRDLAAGYNIGEGSRLLAERRTLLAHERNLAIAESMLSRATIARACQTILGRAA